MFAIIEARLNAQTCYYMPIILPPPPTQEYEMNSSNIERKNRKLTSNANNYIRDLYRAKNPICDITEKMKEQRDVDQYYLPQNVARAIMRGGEALYENKKLLEWLCAIRPLTDDDLIAMLKVEDEEYRKEISRP